MRFDMVEDLFDREIRFVVGENMFGKTFAKKKRSKVGEDMSSKKIRLECKKTS